MIRRLIAPALFLLALFAPAPAPAQGTIPIALQQSVDINGKPLAGALLYVYQVGTVATAQLAYLDTALTIPLPWPIPADGLGRLPMFYLANGAVHVRLTNSSGVVLFDYPSMLVVGASSGTGGSISVDPTTVLSTGDVKFRPSSETLTGWVRMNGQTIGNAVSGASSRANADTQALFIYLWGLCDNNHCPVSSGRGGTGLADFNANKTITLPDWRGRLAVGLDDMGNSAAGRLLSSNVTSGFSDTITTPFATGGEANHLLSITEMPFHSHTATSVVTDPTHRHAPSAGTFVVNASGGGNSAGNSGFLSNAGTSSFTAFASTGITVATTNANTGGNASHNIMQPFMLGSWHMKL